MRYPPRSDDGFALMFVLFVTTMVMIGTAGMLSVVSGNVRPAKSSQDGYAASAAAQSGVQDYLAQLDANCRQISSQSCAWPVTHNPLTGTIGEQSYTVKALNPATYMGDNAGTLRLVSTGRAGGADGVSRTVTADVSGRPSVLRFTYFSNYETLGTSFLRSYYGPRTITLDSGSIAKAVGLTAGSRVHWNGTGTAPANGYTDTVCDSFYYRAPSNPIAGQGRSEIVAARTGLDTGTTFSEDGYTQTASVTGELLGAAPKTAVRRDATCEATFSSDMRFTGPVYSRDALAITNGQVGRSTGPAFDVPDAEPLPPASTGWTAGSSPQPPDPARPYVIDPQLDGVPTTSKSGAAPVVSAVHTLALPASADPRADCTYTGPTRIVLSGGTARISSPGTAPSQSDPCYRSTGTGNGVAEAIVPITTTTLKVRDAATGSGTPTFPGLALGADGDVTTYSPTLGDAYVQGTLTTGRLSVVTSHDVVVTGDLITNTTYGANAFGERSWTSGGAVDLVAANDVRVYHPVACASGSAVDGWCPNDITGLYSARPGSQTPVKVVAGSDGTLKAAHPSRQYTDLSSGPSRVDAAVMALGGSFRTDNFDRGTSRGALTVNGGVYMNHRGALGRLWEVPTGTTVTERPASGYRLQLKYADLAKAGLPFVPVLDYGGTASGPWYIVNISTGGAS